MEKFIRVTITLFAILLVFTLIYWSGLLPFHHKVITFDDGTEYHIRGLINHDSENIIIYDLSSFGYAYETIPINDRGFEVHYCGCENSVAKID